MSNEPWRQAAYDLLPTFRDRVEAAEDVGMLWIELWDCEVAGSAAQITETEISSLFSYASWCLLSGDEKCQNAAIVDFYEMLPTNAGRAAWWIRCYSNPRPLRCELAYRQKRK
jgi:hypothetical protein